MKTEKRIEIKNFLSAAAEVEKGEEVHDEVDAMMPRPRRNDSPKTHRARRPHYMKVGMCKCGPSAARSSA